MKRVWVILVLIAVLLILTEGRKKKKPKHPHKGKHHPKPHHHQKGTHHSKGKHHSKGHHHKNPNPKQKPKPLHPHPHAGKEIKPKKEGKHAFFKLKDIAMCIYKNLTGKGVACNVCANGMKKCYGACSSPKPKESIPQEDGETEYDENDENPGNRLKCFSCFASHMGRCALCMTKATKTVGKCKATHWDKVQEDVRATHETVDNMMAILMTEPVENPSVHPAELISFGKLGSVLQKSVGKKFKKKLKKMAKKGATDLAEKAIAGAAEALAGEGDTDSQADYESEEYKTMRDAGYADYHTDYAENKDYY